MTDQAPNTGQVKFRIFRGAEAPSLEIEQTTGLSDIALAGITKLAEAGGIDNGHDVRVLFEVPGFSLTYCWFKSGFPLPRHSHGVDCAYYIVGGCLQIGTDVLGKGDGFFVPANMPYTYAPGPKGVEVLEFRHHACREIRLMADNPAFWEKLVAAAPVSRARWENEPRPSPTLAEADG
jgi:hypothetical protein